MKIQELELTPSNGSVFEDVGLKDAKQRLAKAELASRISDIIEKRGLNQMQTAELLGVRQPKVSALMCGNLEGFSIEKLLHFLMRLNHDVRILIKERPKNLNNRKNKSYGGFIIAFA